MAIYFMSCSQTIARAQDSLSQSIITEQEIVLPTIDEVLDSAYKNAFEIKAQEIIIEQKREITSIEKKKIFRALTLNSQYSRGNNNAAIDNRLIAAQQYRTSAVTNFYSAGIFLNVSLFQFIGRKNNIQNAKMQERVEKTRLKMLKRNLTIDIKNLYIDCQYKATVLKMRREALSVSNMNFTYIENSFSENAVKMQLYADAAEINIKLKVVYEQALTEYIKSIIVLEEISGIKLRKT